MALIKCENCGNLISDKATKCPKCGCPATKQEVIRAPQNNIQQEQPVYYEEDNNANSKKTLYAIIGVLVALLLGFGLWMWKSESFDNSPDNNSANVVAADSASIEADASAGQSPKEQITRSLGDLFDNVVKGDTHEYDERYFSSDFKRIYKEVDEIDQRFAQVGQIGFWDAGFWDMAQDDVKMNIAVNDVYNVKEDEAMAKVSFKFTSGGQTETRNEDIKVVLENDKWVLDDIHSYKKQMKEYVKENKDFQPFEKDSSEIDNQRTY